MTRKVLLNDLSISNKATSYNFLLSVPYKIMVLWFVIDKVVVYHLPIKFNKITEK